ncbi:DNA polymerase III, psi subunit [secondary endosymbiont of Heteropsylla cubana]|uniref:DNA polymerase III subunit psi n=1 Tax=secondary endosymbiont of Heteropsylla cubana TaxID=134287 RepID=J3YT10_9ENTR|nr:DNA polymerase III subunit psi [secondary endosymbiont of Heteropsylla cubana]AFP85508.1 DNA polymerase III, psi subunit [secondary endosymbiont of Heteropsylla cubana]
MRTKSITRRNWQLKQLGITQWNLRNPLIFQKPTVVDFFNHNTPFLLISNSSIQKYYPFICDVARSMNLNPSQLFEVIPNQVILFPSKLNCYCWWIGIKATKNFLGISFQTDPLEMITQDSNAKRELWKVITRHKRLIANISD